MPEPKPEPLPATAHRSKLPRLDRGCTETSDQLQATKFLREHLASVLKPARLQEQAHDHVLRDEERKRGAFLSACHYIFENPVRANLSETWAAWPYAGCMIPGYPKLSPLDTGYWDRFWTIYSKLTPLPDQDSASPTSL